jgi:hypothetical protein
MSDAIFPSYPQVKMPSPLHLFPSSIQIALLLPILPDKFVTLLASELNVERRVILRYQKRQRWPLEALKELGTITGKDFFEEAWYNDAKYFIKWKTVTLPSVITSKLAYIVGYLQGDGCLDSDGKRTEFSDEYKEQIEQVNTLFHELFGMGGKVCEARSVWSKKPYYRITIGSHIINNYFHSVFSINRGVKKNLMIPPTIRQEKELLRWYLKGLFDADGTFPKHPEKCKQLFVDITFKEKPFIEEIRKQLLRFDIITLTPRCRRAKIRGTDNISETWELQIRRRDMIQTFLREIGFAHPNKRLRTEMFDARVAQLG